MKAITIWQPWASLIAHGKKKIETRSWKAPDNIIGHRIAIHAAVSMPKWVKKLCPGFAKLIGIKDYTGSWLYYIEQGVGPFGKIVATAKLANCIPMIEENKIENYAVLSTGDRQQVVDGPEYHFGDYAPGRYAWILEDIKMLDNPILAKGMQRLWNWDGDAK
ncbi:ASCH domain-containing protein [Ruminiclostridium josui]|uniref:ASCH domain-containing protein n=1 Tax=Ruminiclostridium josui TaxID=1499 RepID=UPI0004654884|nr:ASCH domain-containing protein [Ruminiclostridium josui]